MRLTARAAWALGLSIVGVAALVGPTRGQQDAKVQRSSNNQGAATNRPFGPSVVATLDVWAVLKDYKKMKFRDSELKAEIATKEHELVQLQAQGKNVIKEMETFQQGSEDYKKRESQLTELKVRLDSRKAQLEQEIKSRQGEMLAEAYKEIQSMAYGVAQHKGLTQVLRVENTPPPTTDIEMTLQYISRPIVYSDPANDITQIVLFNLNRLYDQKSSGGAGATPAPSGSSPAGGAAAHPAQAPATPGRSAPPTRSTPTGGASPKQK